MKSTRFVATAIALGFINICAAPHADADPQSTGPAAGSEQSASEANALAEVVVTANRRQENSQSVPITVEAISGDTATSFGVTDMQSLANSVPGLRVDRGTATALPFIRG